MSALLSKKRICSLPPCGGGLGWGGARGREIGASAGAQFSQARATPSPAPPHKGEGRGAGVVEIAP